VVPLFHRTQVVAEVIVAGTTVDSVRTTVGFRATTFSGAQGAPPFTLNGEPMHFRGFSHHNSIGGLGVAIPERAQLFRVQASRAMVCSPAHHTCWAPEFAANA
jgi:beta-galactosidase/beta-glucuronidase